MSAVMTAVTGLLVTTAAWTTYVATLHHQLPEQLYIFIISHECIDKLYGNVSYHPMADTNSTTIFHLQNQL